MTIKEDLAKIKKLGDYLCAILRNTAGTVSDSKVREAMKFFATNIEIAYKAYSGAYEATTEKDLKKYLKYREAFKGAKERLASGTSISEYLDDDTSEKAQDYLDYLEGAESHISYWERMIKHKASDKDYIKKVTFK